ncbi:hypothetical protein [Paractinoplanes durhamensis]|nr:hypothetical protein [Actinoplanes durhamensis]
MQNTVTPKGDPSPGRIRPGIGDREGGQHPVGSAQLSTTDKNQQTTADAVRGDRPLGDQPFCTGCDVERPQVFDRVVAGPAAQEQHGLSAVRPGQRPRRAQREAPGADQLGGQGVHGHGGHPATASGEL